jgi:hypothetical protein
MEENFDHIELNEFQTPLTPELQKEVGKQIWGQLNEYITTVPFIRWLISPVSVRGYAKDRPKDPSGKIIVDITKPHILEDMDFFREKALFFREHGVYTHLPRNSNPKSEYANFWKEELRKWKYGVTRPSDGEWIPGGLYFYWNYSQIWMVEKALDEDGNEIEKKGERKHDFPRPYLGDYLFYHYLEQATQLGKHGKMLKARGIGASFKFASMSPRNMYVYPGSGNPNFHLASDKSFLLGDKGIWGKVIDNLDWIADNTPLPKMRLFDGKKAMELQLGVEDDYGTRKGLLSSVYGISLKDNPDKARGVRGPLIHYEEDGLFPNLETAWNINREATEEDGIAYGLMFAAGTGGTEGASFEGSEKLFYKCDAYNIYGIPNVFDKNTDGSTTCGFFWGAYLNKGKSTTHENGEVDVIKRLIMVLQERKKIADASNDPKALTQKKAETPITPQEAVMRSEGTLFPVSDLKDYLGEILPSLATFISNHFIGNLGINSNGEIEYRPNADIHILRDFPLQDNLRKEGGIEIFETPKKGMNGFIPKFRYISGIDPYDDDHSTTTSLGSMFVFDLFTDRIVAEYTGRPLLANNFYENCYRLLKYYNAIALYEAHPYSEIVKLPNGTVKNWGDIHIGDELFAPNGKITKVIDIPVNEYMPIYKVKLNDGREVLCSDNHIWSVYRLNQHPHEIKNYSTKEMMEIGIQNNYKQNNFFIPNGGAVEYPEQVLNIPPYLMGLIISEGCIRGSHCTKNQIQISSGIEDMDFYKTIIPNEIKYSGTKGANWNFVIKDCKKILKQLRLLGSRSETKFIPDIYLFNSYKNRLELLKGLMDGDGHATKGGSPVYVTSSKKLASDFSSLCRSLGFNCKTTKNKTSNLDSYKVIIYTDKIIFKLPRKVSKQYKHDSNAKGSKASSYIDKIAIKSIEFSHYEMGKCITVDAPDGRYLVNDYIVTHNCDKKGLFTYFSNKNILHYLADAPQILKDMEMVKATNLYGNKSKGFNSGKTVNAWGRRLQADWMLSPSYEDKNKLNLHTIRSIGYLKEAISWNADGNFDRVSAMTPVMILREEYFKHVLQAQENSKKINLNNLSVDPFFTNNFNNKTGIAANVKHIIMENSYNDLSKYEI